MKSNDYLGTNNLIITFIKQKLQERQQEINKKQLVIGNLNPPLSVKDRSQGQKLSI